MWTLSGSCPLCLTLPCYHLEPPATAAPFLSQYRSKQQDDRGGFNLHGNYIAMLTIHLSGQDRPARAMLTQSYTECVSAPRKYEACHVRKAVERNAAGVVRRAPRRLAGLRRLVPRRHGSG